MDVYKEMSGTGKTKQVLCHADFDETGIVLNKRKPDCLHIRECQGMVAWEEMRGVNNFLHILDPSWSLLD